VRLKVNFETMELDDEIVAIPTGNNSQLFHGVIKLNDTGAFILDLLQKDISEEEIIGHISEEYDASKEQIAADVHMYLEKFRSRGLLEE
jgi:hypothetical protein